MRKVIDPGADQANPVDGLGSAALVNHFLPGNMVFDRSGLLSHFLLLLYYDLL
jgi:hypothetical protein